MTLLIKAVRRVLASKNTYYHGSPKDHGEIFKVQEFGTQWGQDFGGVFLASHKMGHISFGKNYWYKVEIDDSDILEPHRLYFDFDQNDNKILKVLPHFDTEEDFDLAWEIICERASEEEEDRLFGDSDRGSGGWELQRIHGQIAKALGFKAVELKDERGTVYLLPGPATMFKDENQSDSIGE